MPVILVGISKYNPTGQICPATFFFGEALLDYPRADLFLYQLWLLWYHNTEIAYL